MPWDDSMISNVTGTTLKSWVEGRALLAMMMGVGVMLLAAPAMAQSQASVSAMLRGAMLGIGPSPVARMINPQHEEWLQDEEIQAWLWPTPVERAWPTDEEGRPVVETRRRDVFFHEVGPRDTLSRLRSMYRVTTAMLEEMNPELDLRDLQEGQQVKVWELDDASWARSVGRANSGRLIRGEPMPPAESYILLYPHRAFGTYYAVSETVRVLDAYYQTFNDAPPLIVGDMSFRTGRAISPHRSHRSGRDVDVTLPRLVEPPNYNRFHYIRRDHLDTQRTLWMVLKLLEGGMVEHIFLDWYHQRTLYRLARDQGAPEAWLREVFQYPRRGGSGIVRHEPGHRKHLHVRYRCQETDRWCG
ncbi:LysM peptidoglycan-binding domain-containing protein [Lujinxingia sediminis]|uniref:LysM peptidoglycan-binding domain-containing protein n=2 Tax=Lujinxingia sediminis TaxID=2480984 RepID=A0ABY0CR16_9DELT|nr:LysM peptidoglycan-binding domain-containing protein [Lujinxingia sediminis]